MINLKRYLAVMLIALFSVATAGSVAMAHCSHSAPGHETPEIDRKMDGCSHTHSVEEAVQDDRDHHNAGEKTHGHSDTDQNEDNETTSCLDCDAGLCKTQNVVSANSVPVYYAAASSLHSEKDLNLKSVFLSIIPDPPNSIS